MASQKRSYEETLAAGSEDVTEEELSTDAEPSALSPDGFPEQMPLALIEAKLSGGSDFDTEVRGFLLDRGEQCLDKLYAQRLADQQLADLLARQMYFAGDVVLPKIKCVELVCKALKVALNRLLMRAERAADIDGSVELRPKHAAAQIAAYGPKAVTLAQSYLEAKHFRKDFEKDKRGDHTAFSDEHDSDDNMKQRWVALLDGDEHLVQLFHSTDRVCKAHHQVRDHRCHAMTQSEFIHYHRWLEKFTFHKSGSPQVLSWMGWQGNRSVCGATFELYALLARTIVADITEHAISLVEGESTSKVGTALPLDLYEKAVRAVLSSIPKPES